MLRARIVRSLVAALVAAMSVAVLGFAVVSNRNQIDRFAEERYLSCQDDNELRAAEIRLWEGVISISTPPADETPAQKAVRAQRLAQFRALLNEVFAPKDCGVAPG